MRIGLSLYRDDTRAVQGIQHQSRKANHKAYGDKGGSGDKDVPQDILDVHTTILS